MKVPGVTLFALLAVLIGVPLTGQERSVVAAGAVRAEDLLASPVGTNWTSYNGDYTGRRYSALREINTANVHQLRAAWVFHPGNSQNLETTPVVVRGVGHERALRGRYTSFSPRIKVIQSWNA